MKIIEFPEQEALMPPLRQSQGISAQTSSEPIHCWSPAEAEAEACKMDDFSAPPVYVCSLKDLTIHRAPGVKRK